jgi:ATP-binding protein involved in chromosome partitioning
MEQTQVEVALRNVVDPLTGQDIVTAKRISEITIRGDQINCSLVYMKPPLDEKQKSALNFACLEVLQRRFPEAQVHIHMETKLRAGMPPRSVLPQVQNILAVASGKGGVGKSTISTNLALALQTKGFKVGLIDADLYGPSIPTMLGLFGQRPQLKDIQGKPKIVPLEAYGLKVISIGFIVEPEQAVVLRGPRLAGIIKQFIEECLWPELDYLIIDLPPGTGDIQLTLVQTAPVTGAIMVTTPQKVAVADAVKAMNMFRMPSIKVPIIGVIENMSWFTPPELPDHKYTLFGVGGGQELATEAGTSLLGQVPIVQALRESGDRGKPIVLDDDEPGMQSIWGEIATQTHAMVQARNEAIDPTEIVKIKS